MNDKKIITFHFTSGKIFEYRDTSEGVEEIINIMKKKWDSYLFGNEYGINLSLVTHYEVRDAL